MRLEEGQGGFLASFAFVALAHYVFGLRGRDAQLVVISSALPTRTGAFMLADIYKRDLGVTSTPSWLRWCFWR